MYKKNFFLIAVAVAIGVVAAVNVGVTSNGRSISDLTFANIEALSQIECYSNDSHCTTSQAEVCGSCYINGVHFNVYTYVR